jgi:hypothetical protein
VRSDAFSRRNQLKNLAQLIVGPQEDATSCDQYRERLEAYTEAESEGQSAAQLDPEVRQHLETCLACQELYADLLNIARLEAANQLPQLTRTLQFDLSFLLPRKTLVQGAYESIRAILQVIHSDYLADLDLIWDRLSEILKGLADQLDSQPLQIPSAQTLGFTGEDSVLRWAVATFTGLQSVRATATREEIERLKSTGKLRGLLSPIAQEAARQAGLKGQEAHKFADTFARLHSEERWKELILWTSSDPTKN